MKNAVYTLAVRRDFIARHYLTGGDWGSENLPHSHHYVLELQLEGSRLDGHGFVVDILEVESCLEEVIGRFRDQMLNDRPGFKGLNPSLEHFVRILATDLNDRIEAQNLTGLRVVLWENESAWAAYEVSR